MLRILCVENIETIMLMCIGKEIIEGIDNGRMIEVTAEKSTEL